MSVNGVPTDGLTHSDAVHLIQNSSSPLVLLMRQTTHDQSPERTAGNATTGRLNVKCAIPHDECRRGVHLSSLGREPVSVTRGQCNARSTVTFSAIVKKVKLAHTQLLRIGFRS